jgi:hypothetical protein
MHWQMFWTCYRLATQHLHCLQPCEFELLVPLFTTPADDYNMVQVLSVSLQFFEAQVSTHFM